MPRSMERLAEITPFKGGVLVKLKSGPVASDRSAYLLHSLHRYLAK